MSSILEKQVAKEYLSMRYHYSHAQELTASASKPLHKRKRDPLVLAVQDAVQAVGYGSPVVEQWRILADAANLAETMLTLGLFDDPGALFSDAVAAVVVLGRAHGLGQPMRVSASQLMHLTEFAEAYEQMLAQASERNYIHAHRATERRLRELLMNGSGAGDYEFIVN